MNVSRRRYMGVGSSPYDAELEFISGNGTPTITLPLNVGANDFFEVSGKVQIDNSYSVASNALYIITNNMATVSSAPFAICHGSTTSNTEGTTSTWNYINRVSDGMTFPGGVFSTFALSTEGKTINGAYTASQRELGAALSSIKIYFRRNILYAWLKIKAGTSILYDLIPVRTGNVGYLFDKISKTLFAQDAEGSFLLGRDITMSDNMLYWWESEDSLSYYNNAYCWFDRIRKTPAAATNYNKVDSLWEINGSDISPNRFFTLNSLNAGFPIVLPPAWRLEAELLIPSGQSSTQPAYIFDGGSVTTAKHAFGISIHHSTQKIAVNYKPTNNNDNAVYGFSGISQIEIANDTLIKIELGTTYVNDTQVQIYQKYNDIRVLGKAPHDSMAYNGNWNQNVGYIGRSYSQPYCGGKYYLKSLKFFDNSQV